mmetsp:Transcript_14960/g.32037  ORF Transcript_14960/g.32037 Transcript_14960/m.32037 type:complete len:200 (-) Transcript_14960:1321-1920(-)
MTATTKTTTSTLPTFSNNTRNSFTLFPFDSVRFTWPLTAARTTATAMTPFQTTISSHYHATATTFPIRSAGTSCKLTPRTTTTTSRASSFTTETPATMPPRASSRLMGFPHTRSPSPTQAQSSSRNTTHGFESRNGPTTNTVLFELTATVRAAAILVDLLVATTSTASSPSSNALEPTMYSSRRAASIGTGSIDSSGAT